MTRRIVLARPILAKDVRDRSKNVGLSHRKGPKCAGAISFSWVFDGTGAELRAIYTRPEEPKRQQRQLRSTHRVHDVWRIVHQAITAGLPPRTAPLTPFSGRKHHIQLLGRVAVVGIPRMPRHQTYTDPNITPHIETLRANNRPVCVANEEVLALRLGSSPGAPSESRLDGSECIGQRCDRTAMKACLCQRRVQMTAGRLSTRSCPAGYGGGLLQSRKDALRSRSAWPWDMHPTPDHGFSHS